MIIIVNMVISINNGMIEKVQKQRKLGNKMLHFMDTLQDRLN